MHRLDARLAQLQLDGEGEIGGIDADEHIGLFGDQGLDQQLAPLEQLAQAPQHLDQTHDREAFHGEIGLQAFGLHQRAADADEAHIRMARLEGTHQPGTENIAAGLTRDQGYAKLRHVSG
ncbi:hypothetical protein D3C76_1472510 [compost metagenome]